MTSLHCCIFAPPLASWKQSGKKQWSLVQQFIACNFAIESVVDSQLYFSKQTQTSKKLLGKGHILPPLDWLKKIMQTFYMKVLFQENSPELPWKKCFHKNPDFSFNIPWLNETPTLASFLGTLFWPHFLVMSFFCPNYEVLEEVVVVEHRPMVLLAVCKNSSLYIAHKLRNISSNAPYF